MEYPTVPLLLFLLYSCWNNVPQWEVTKSLKYCSKLWTICLVFFTFFLLSLFLNVRKFYFYTFNGQETSWLISKSSIWTINMLCSRTSLSVSKTWYVTINFWLPFPCSLQCIFWNISLEYRRRLIRWNTWCSYILSFIHKIFYPLEFCALNLRINIEHIE
jgi:hypothetical protein